MLTDRLITYARGRRTDALDLPGVDKTLAGLRRHQYGLRSRIQAVIASDLLLSR